MCTGPAGRWNVKCVVRKKLRAAKSAAASGPRSLEQIGNILFPASSLLFDLKLDFPVAPSFEISALCKRPRLHGTQRYALLRDIELYVRWTHRDTSRAAAPVDLDDC